MRYLEEPYTLIDRPLWWHLRGLQQTPSGYGSKLTTSYCVLIPDGKVRRVYATCWSNAATYWVVLDGERTYLRGTA